MELPGQKKNIDVKLRKRGSRVQEGAKAETMKEGKQENKKRQRERLRDMDQMSERGQEKGEKGKT